MPKAVEKITALCADALMRACADKSGCPEGPEWCERNKQCDAEGRAACWAEFYFNAALVRARYAEDVAARKAAT